MPLLDGPSLGGNARHVLRQYAEENALARGRGANAAGTEEFGGGCLRGRYNNLREVIQNNPSLVVVPSIINAGSLFVQRPICRTNYLPNNSMAGATGSVLPTNWSLSTLPAGITVSYSASGTAVAADGTSVNYIDVTVSGTAGASGFLNLRPTPSPSTIAAFIGQSWNTSVYLQLISGSVSGISPTWQLQELNSSQTFLQGSNVSLSSLAVAGPFERYDVSRVFTDSATAFVTCRWGHSFVSGTSYSYTIRIGSPQLERFSVPTPMIATSTGAVTRLNESTNVVGLPPDFTVSRNTTATRVNSSGLIESVASGVPRIDWLGQSCPALLVEPAATNLTKYSEQFNTVTSGWSPSNLETIASNVTATLDPAGGNTADLIVATTTSGVSHKIFSNTNNFPSFVSGTAYTLSVFAKATSTTSGFVQIAMGGNDFSPALPFANFQLSGNGAVTTGTYSAATIQSFGNGWYRCSLTATAVASGTAYTGLFVPILASGTARDGNFTGNGVDGVYLWGAQLETGSVATTYIPTTTAAVSRAADVCSVSGVSGYIGQTEGTIYAEVDLRNWTASGRILTCSNGTSDERLMIQVGANRTLQAIVTTASADVADISTASGQVNGVYKCALTYASGDFAFYVNGTQIGTDSSGGVPACTSVFLGKIGTSASTNFLNDRIRAAALYTTRLSNDQLAELTRL